MGEIQDDVISLKLATKLSRAVFVGLGPLVPIPKLARVQSTATDLTVYHNKDWEDIKFGVDNEVDFFVVSFVKDARVLKWPRNGYRKLKATDDHKEIDRELLPIAGLNRGRLRKSGFKDSVDVMTVLEGQTLKTDLVRSRIIDEVEGDNTSTNLVASRLMACSNLCRGGSGATQRRYVVLQSKVGMTTLSDNIIKKRW
ncbi:hypothetical protein JHK87_007170 [Glycine soja]|nr:hypothetical protein JHK87_007170 [Glycine soja]